MGQYYKPYLKFTDGHEECYCSQNAIFMTRHGIEKLEEIREHPLCHSWNWDDPDSYGSCFSGMKLTEHSWIGNDFVDGIVGLIECEPARIAWVGDYSDEEAESGAVKGYDKDIYCKVWGDKSEDEAVLPELPFPALPDKHRKGYLVNYTQGIYLDLEKYIEDNRNDEGWCIHPLPLLTEIGNGKGGGDYWSEIGKDDLGSWAMDTITYLDEWNVLLMFFTEVTYRFDSNA